MRNTGYKQAHIAKKVTWPSHLPLNEAGEIISEIHMPEDPNDSEYLEWKKQAILLLEGEENPDETNYKVLGNFEIGQKIGYYQEGKIWGNTDTRIFSPDCIEDGFRANKSSLSYGVSYQGKGFEFNDSIQIYSVLNARYQDYTITSKPDWIKLYKGTSKSLTNTLNLIVDRNRTDDDDRRGDIVLTQTKTNYTITINITQKGRLTEGIPTEYPYVNTDTVLGKKYSIAQIGEQIWLRRGLNHYIKEGTGIMNDYRLQEWQKLHPDYITPTAEEFNSVSGYAYSILPREEVKKNLNTENNDTPENLDIYKHQVPDWDTDILEMIGFLAAKAGCKKDTDFRLATGTSLVKKILDITEDGYDDIRFTYPSRWTAKGSGFDDVSLKSGDDRYALNQMTLGNFHPTDESAIESRLFWFTEMNVRGGNTTDPNGMQTYASYGAETTKDYELNYKGWNKREFATGFHAKQIRTVRYRKLDFDWYQNNNGYHKFYNNETIPDGYTIVPKGIYRGILFGNPNLSASEVGTLAFWIMNGGTTINGKIG